MNSISSLRSSVAALFLSAVVSSAASAATSPTAGAIGSPGKATAATRTVTITMGDMYFEPAKLTVKPGETVRFVVKNTGELLHEFNIATAAMHADHQKEMAMMVDHGMITATGINQSRMQMGHGGHGGMTHDHANSVLVEPGKTAELIWTFPTAATLEFACNIPGHYEAGMVGGVTIAK